VRLVGFIKKKFVMMHGHMNVNQCRKFLMMGKKEMPEPCRDFLTK